MQIVKLKLKSIAPMLMHSDRFSNPLDPATKVHKELTSKRKKTEADEADIGKLQWFGGLYHDPEVGIYVPSWNVVRCFERAASITRLGTALTRAFVVSTDKLPLHHEGPAKPEKLWELPEYRWRTTVGVQRARVTRVRPIFRRWSLELEAELLEDVLDPDDLRRIIDLAGRSEGLGDARKLGYGRFTSEVVM